MNTARALIVAFFILCAVGITLPVFLPAHKSPRVIAWIGSLASVVLCAVGLEALIFRTIFAWRLWTIPALSNLSFSLDPLAGLFLLVTGVIFLATSIFTVRFLDQYSGDFSLTSFAVVYHLLLLSVAVILLAGDVVLFLIGWEAMSILAFLLVNCQRRREGDRDAGYSMLTMGEAGFLAVCVAFLLLGGVSGGLSFSAIRISSHTVGAGICWAVFLLSFFGFSVKAGLVPFNRWMTRVYAVAPANVCALLSGVLLNLGIYGIIRVNGDLLLPASVLPGLIVLGIGSASALIGILYANRETDMKTMLAESSIENMGIVTAGLGAGLIFSASHAPVLAGIAFIAALYQMVNHSVYKSLLFFGAGSVESEVGTCNMDRLGGLIKSIPWIAAFFLVGTLSIASLPPLSGFVSEWLTLQSLLLSASLKSVGVKVAFALSGAVLALTAALAVTCFVKVYAMSFLGVPRSENAPRSTTLLRRPVRFAMGFLALLCIALGILPTYIISALNGPARQLGGASSTYALVPPFFTTGPQHPTLPPAFVAAFHNLGAQLGRRILPGPGLVVLHQGSARNPVVFAMSTSYMLIVLLILAGAAFLLARKVLGRRRSAIQGSAWAGGLRPLLPELTYTATGFSNPVRVTFNAVFHPTEMEDSSEMVGQHFRMAIRRRVREIHVLDRWLYRPIHAISTRIAAGLAGMHHGRLNAYVAYVLVALVVVLVFGRLL
jgi:hydrogenase-4 component B